ncbi:MAG: ABC transporter ATP-binding protein [Planctomycetes bacterium]|nr:ABC transporter ATP-binding protein [Planctomycetota bacterium]MBL7008189.1 ABC transporter ATP-binding protein [Planctomycetota bacterium]
MLPYLRRYRRKAALAVGLGAVAALGSKANIAFLQPLVNRLFPEMKSAGAGVTSLGAFDDWLGRTLSGLDLFGLGEGASIVIVLGGCLLVSAAVFSLIQYVFLRLSRMLGVWMVADLRQDLARHVLDLGMRYHSGRRLGDLLSRLTADVSTSLRLLTLVVEELIQEPFNILAAFTVAYLAAPTATLGMLVFLPILALPIVILGPKVRKRSQKSLAKFGDTTQAMTQMFSGIRVVKAFRMEEREAEEFRRVNQEFVHQTDRMVKTQATSLSITNFLAQGGIGVAIGLIALANHLLEEKLFVDVGAMVAFFAATGFLFTSVKRLTKAASIIYSSMGATERVFEVFDLEPEIHEDSGQLPFTGLKSEIRFEGVGFDYGSGDAPAIKDVSFTVKRGEQIALVGSSGAGKSTLLDLVARFYDPTEGRILVDGVDLRQLKVSDWLNRLAMVGQQPFLFQTSLRENVRYGRPEAGPEEVERACRAAYMDEFVGGLPLGLDTEAGEAGARLSGGQAQRVTIARAILRDADVLLLDEATSALDSESERRVQDALENLVQGRTTFAIAHRLSTIRKSDRILVFEQGRIVEDGSHDQLVARGGIYAKMWRLQADSGSGL